MRDYLVLAGLFVSLPFCFARPHIGVLVWILVSLMNPHRLTWGIAYHFPVALLVGGMTLAGFVFARGKSRFPWTSETSLLILLFAWFSLTTVTALFPDLAAEEWQRLGKTYVMVLISLVLFQSQARLRLLLMAVSISIAVFGVKGALFAIRTGGNYLVFGPPGSFIADNNALALAELMVVPLLASLAQSEQNPWMKRGMYVAAGLSVFAIVFSYSRGAFVTLAGLAIVAILFSKNRFRYLLISAIFVLAILPLAPEKWHSRMGTIETYEEDRSAQGRINAWHFATNLALDRPFVGGGFRTFRTELFLRYAPDPYSVHDAHSIYFEVLGEHGFVALGLFVGLLLLLLKNLAQCRSAVGRRPDLAWAGIYAMGLQFSVIAYMIGGAFLGLAYFDLYYYIVAASVCLRVVVRARLAEPAPGEARPSDALAPATLKPRPVA